LAQALCSGLAHSENKAARYGRIVGLSGGCRSGAHFVTEILKRNGPAQPSLSLIRQGLTILLGPISDDVARLQNLDLKGTARESRGAQNIPEGIRDFGGAGPYVPNDSEDEFIGRMLENETSRILTLGHRQDPRQRILGGRHYRNAPSLANPCTQVFCLIDNGLCTSRWPERRR